jgi:hypothetical protein
MSVDYVGYCVRLLSNYNQNKAVIEVLRAEIKAIENDVGLRSTGMVEFMGKKYNSSSPVENEAVFIYEKVKNKKKRIEVLELEVRKVDIGMGNLNKVQEKIIRKRYIEGKQWYQVARLTGLSERQCRNLKDEAFCRLISVMFPENCG